MKIAVWHNLPSGGGKRALYDHVKGLVERGHTVEAWCPPTADIDYLPLSDLVTEHRVGLDVEKDRLKALYRKVSGGLEINNLVRAMQKHSRKCAHQMAQIGFDVLLANSCQFFGAPFIGRAVEMPKALYLQEPNRGLYETSSVSASRWAAQPTEYKERFPNNIRAMYQDLRQTQNWRIQVREEWLNAKSFDAVLVNSRFSRESMRRSYGINARLCYLGVDTSLFQHATGQVKEDFVVGLGAFERHKNIGFVVDAIALIPEPRPRLVWIGNNHFSSVYLNEIKSQANANNVQFEAKVKISDEELLSLLGKATVMAYAPILEPFGYAPLEANACGLPVVGVAEGGVRETVVDGVNGLLVEADPAAMAQAIDCLRQKPEWASELGKKARAYVEANWTVAQGVDRLEQELRGLLRAHHAS